MQIKNIDFNIDLAQSFGFYKNNSEFDLLDYASSVNISCGFHAGDPLTIRNALLRAKEKNVVVGAHIGFDDIQFDEYVTPGLTTMHQDSSQKGIISAEMILEDIKHGRSKGKTVVLKPTLVERESVRQR